jgi:hypothetical protein
VYNIQKAVSRLDFAPQIKEIQVTDIKKGLGVFTPKPERAVSFALLKAALKKAGYTLDASDITVRGTLAQDAGGWWLVAEPSGQRFRLEGANLKGLLAEMKAGERVELAGDWKTVGTGPETREVITPREIKSAERVAQASINDEHESFAHAGPENTLAPIRTTSPGLTVYKGGAVSPRLFLIEQHLGHLNVSRQVVQLGLSYTPTQRLQLEAEIPYSRAAFEQDGASGAGHGQGNLILRGKYRFYREVETWGDRQAAVRFGVELPTGDKSAPSEKQLNAPAYVRQQLSSINGGLAALFDTAYSQARGRVIFGGNLEGVLRSERDGFRTGHELRVNTDLEYVLLPLKYRSPTKELFAILETSLVHKGLGRVEGGVVPASSSTEYFIAPGLQYVATSRLAIEASAQFPLMRRTGPQTLRTDRNILLGVKYLF